MVDVIGNKKNKVDGGRKMRNNLTSKQASKQEIGPLIYIKGF